MFLDKQFNKYQICLTTNIIYLSKAKMILNLTPIQDSYTCLMLKYIFMYSKMLSVRLIPNGDFNQLFKNIVLLQLTKKLTT